MANNMDIDNNSFTIRDIMDVTPNQRIAMLIDGDNAQPSMIEKMLAETTKYGLITIRRIYGDWTASNMGGWKEVLQTHAIQPIQQFRYTVGKNATDSAMIIDAMDLFYSGNVDGFCLVSSDSDYTRLATRIHGDRQKTDPARICQCLRPVRLYGKPESHRSAQTGTAGKEQPQKAQQIEERRKRQQHTQSDPAAEESLRPGSTGKRLGISGIPWASYPAAGSGL